MRTKYRITATMERDGQLVGLDQAEVLGEAYGHTFATREEAEALASEMQAEVGDYGLDDSTRYTVEEVEVDDDDACDHSRLVEGACRECGAACDCNDAPLRWEDAGECPIHGARS